MSKAGDPRQTPKGEGNSLVYGREGIEYGDENVRGVWCEACDGDHQAHSTW
jgi:hypothetical protein